VTAGESAVRTGLLAILAFGTAGVGVELALIGHYEDTWQVLPLALLGLALGAMAAVALRPTRAMLTAFRGVAAACTLSGLVGQYLHYRGNSEFELEVFPDLSGWELFAESLRGATPVLAPGTMTVIGLLGLLYAWRHPALQASSSDSRERTFTSS